MNANIEALNNGTQHKPIRKVRCYEAGSKFAIGSIGNKKDKFVEADKGTNLYFAIYSDTEGKRVFETVPLNEVIDRLKQGMSPVPEYNSDDFKLLFYLSPNDLVYVPTDEEIRCGNVKLLKERIYKMVSSSGPQCHFVYSRVAVVIINKGEFSPLNKMERAISGEMIKEVCIPIKVNRLGEIKYIGTEFLPKGNLK
jgi:CRISPR-associated endonuclease Csn1